MAKVSRTKAPRAKAPSPRKRYSLGLVILGVIVILLGLAWTMPLVAWLFADRIPVSSASLKDYLDLLAPDRRVPVTLIRWTVLASPLPLLVFGIGLLRSARWAKTGAIVALLGQAAALLLIVRALAGPAHPEDLGGFEFVFIPRAIYPQIGAVFAGYFALIVLLCLFRAQRRK